MEPGDGTSFKLAGFEVVGAGLKLVDQVAEERPFLGQFFGHRLVLVQRGRCNKMQGSVDHDSALTRYTHRTAQVGDARFRKA